MFLSILKVLSELNLGFFSFKYIYVKPTDKMSAPQGICIRIPGRGCDKIGREKVVYSLLCPFLDLFVWSGSRNNKYTYLYFISPYDAVT